MGNYSKILIVIFYSSTFKMQMYCLTKATNRYKELDFFQQSLIHKFTWNRNHKSLNF